MFDKNQKLTKEQLLKAISQLENNPNDKLRILGDIGIVGVGTGLGIASAGTIAAAAGATSIPVLTTVGSWVGVTLVGATPVGWVVGAAVAGGAAAFGVSRLIKSGSYTEGKQQELLNSLKDRMCEIEAKQRASSIGENDRTQFHIFLKQPLQFGLISADDAQGLITAVESGQMPLNQAYQLVKDIINSGKK